MRKRMVKPNVKGCIRNGRPVVPGGMCIPIHECFVARLIGKQDQDRRISWHVDDCRPTVSILSRWTAGGWMKIVLMLRKRISHARKAHLQDASLFRRSRCTTKT